jgi:hypothetical protein
MQSILQPLTLNALRYNTGYFPKMRLKELFMRQQFMFYANIILIILLSGVLAVWFYSYQDGKDMLNFTISIVGFSIALLALFIAVRTYLSIDSVDNMGKMDGNILDNENYVTSAAELILEYQDKNEKALEKKMFETIKRKLNKESNTAAQFADTLQYMIDLIIFFPAVFNAKETDKAKYDTEMEKIIKMAEKKHDIIKYISKGNSIQIKETIKLFKGVTSYQKQVAGNNFNIYADLLHVRGPILRNPVTKTIYHNYIGLYYNKKGMNLLRKELGTGREDLLSIPVFKSAEEKFPGIKDASREDMKMYLEAACEHFDKALSISAEDVAWPGFINYNKARTLYFLSLLDEKNSADAWVDVMQQAIASRSKVNRLIDEVLNSEDTHLKEFFLHQEELARLVNLNLTYCSPHLSEQKKKLVYKGSDLTEMSRKEIEMLFQKITSFSVIKKYQDELLSAL